MDDPSQSLPSSAADPCTHRQAASTFGNSRSQLMLPIHPAFLQYSPRPRPHPRHHPHPHPRRHHHHHHHHHLHSEPLVAYPPTSAAVPPPNPQSSHAPRPEPALSPPPS